MATSQKFKDVMIKPGPFITVTSSAEQQISSELPIDPSFRFSDMLSQEVLGNTNGLNVSQEVADSTFSRAQGLTDVQLEDLFTFNKEESPKAQRYQSEVETPNVIINSPITLNMSGSVAKSIRNETIRRHFFTDKDAVISALNTSMKVDASELRENYQVAETRMRNEITRLKQQLNKAETAQERMERSYQSQVKLVNAQCAELQEENESLRKTIRDNQMVVVKWSSGEMNQYKSTEIGQLENQVRNLQGEIELRDGREKMFKQELDMLRKRMESSEEEWQKQIRKQLEEISAKDCQIDQLTRKLRLKSLSFDPGAGDRLNKTGIISRMATPTSILRSNFVSSDRPFDPKQNYRPLLKQGRSTNMVSNVLTTPRKSSTGLGQKFLKLKMEKARLEGELGAASGSSELRAHLHQELAILNSLMTKLKHKMNL